MRMALALRQGMADATSNAEESPVATTFPAHHQPYADHPHRTTLELVLLVVLGLVLSVSLTSHRVEPVDDRSHFPMRAP
jgi:hypothetical protein